MTRKGHPPGRTQGGGGCMALCPSLVSFSAAGHSGRGGGSYGSFGGSFKKSSTSSTRGNNKTIKVNLMKFAKV